MKRRIFGKPISSSYQLGLTEQVHDILCEEIQAGHWQVGDRLPSIAALAEQSGLSRWPIQRAYETLKEEGYVEQRPDRSGTVLISRLPEGRKPLGAIGIALMAEDDSVPMRVSYQQQSLHVILREAALRNLTTEMASLSDLDEWRRVDSVDGAFGDRVKGVLSLKPFRPDESDEELPSDRMPMVFVGGVSRYCSPSVSSDVRYGYYLLTKRLLKEGHRRIAVCCYSPIQPLVKEACVQGHEAAMREAGLPVDFAAIERSEALAEGDLVGIRAFVEEFLDATAMICMSIWRAQNLISVADMLGIRVPEDLSVTSHGPGPMRVNDPSKTIACQGRDFDQIVKSAFDLLLEMLETRHTSVRSLTIKPFLLEGDSIAPPRKGNLHALKSTDSSISTALHHR